MESACPPVSLALLDRDWRGPSFPNDRMPWPDSDMVPTRARTQSRNAPMAALDPGLPRGRSVVPPISVGLADDSQVDRWFYRWSSMSAPQAGVAVLPAERAGIP